jgi:hypothetical protein
MVLLAKAAAAWVVLLVVMFGNGVFRVLVLQPRLGEAGARQAACLSGIVLILGVTHLIVPWLGRRGRGALFAIGALWLLLTVAFEFLFGHYVAGLPSPALLEEYDLRRGRLWPLVLAVTFVAPWLWGAVLADERPA